MVCSINSYLQHVRICYLYNAEIHPLNVDKCRTTSLCACHHVGRGTAYAGIRTSTSPLVKSFVDERSTSVWSAMLSPLAVCSRKRCRFESVHQPVFLPRCMLQIQKRRCHFGRSWERYFRNCKHYAICKCVAFFPVV